MRIILVVANLSQPLIQQNFDEISPTHAALRCEVEETMPLSSDQGGYVRFGSKADICAATSHVRFTPNSDRESGFPQKAMSALP